MVEPRPNIVVGGVQLLGKGERFLCRKLCKYLTAAVNTGRGWLFTFYLNWIRQKPRRNRVDDGTED